MMDSNYLLPPILADIRAAALSIPSPRWPELGALLDGLLPDPMDPLALLPVCTGVACGAHPDELVPIAAAIAVTGVGLRVLDDCADQDNPAALYLDIGIGRAANLGAALTSAAAASLFHLSLSAEPKARLIDSFYDALLTVGRGQEEELWEEARSLDTYSHIVQQKTVAAFSFAATAGAFVAMGRGIGEDEIEACRRCGAHFGWMIQILDDTEALWFPDAASDLELGRPTFPLLYGVAEESPAAHELRRILTTTKASIRAVCALLDRMDMRGRLMEMALDHRDAALAALGPPLLAPGQHMLELCLDWIFRDGERLLGHV